VPGFVEIHTHGCGGYDFGDLTEEAFLRSAECYRAHGTTTVLPTSVSCSDEDMTMLFELFRKVSDKAVVNYAGLHLEGPYLSMEMKGAQNPRYIRTPEKVFVSKITDNADIVRLITAAPEIEGAEYLARECKKAGIALSVGHSAATAEQVKAAEKTVFCHVTHMYCGTTSNRKIGQTVYSGIVEAAYLSDDMLVELIGDGKHIPKETMQLALKIKGSDRINLTSDSMRAAGTNLTESYLGAISPENRVIIEDGVAKLPDRSSYAGSIATSDMILRKMVVDYELPLVDVVKMLSLTPARIVGLDKTKGSIEVGKDGDILMLDSGLNIEKVLN
jgi:N-acetylglucosamine-6-phosphate deacetylase